MQTAFTAPAQLIFAPAQLFSALTQPPATEAAVYTALLFHAMVQNSLVPHHLNVPFPTSLGMSEKVSTAEHVNEASSEEQANEWAVRK